MTDQNQPLYRITLRWGYRDLSGYYIDRWMDDTITVIAATHDEARELADRITDKPARANQRRIYQTVETVPYEVAPAHTPATPSTGQEHP